MDKHIVSHQNFHHSTQRNEVFAYCGYTEEASGSGRHTVDVGEVDCETCKKLEAIEYEDDHDFYR